MNFCIVAAPAKINLYLDIVSRREDGYHEILSIMQTVSLCDEITIEISDKAGIELACDDDSLPTDKGNIAYRAAELFLKHACIDCGVKIGLRKSIPAAAGLAGGSADAAAVLRGLNKIFKYPFNSEILCDMAASLGADVPFCVRGGCMCAEGIGEKLTELPCMPECYIVIACPDERVSTPAAYSELDRLHDGFKSNHFDKSDYFVAEAALCQKSLDGICKKMYNIFEQVHKDRQDISELKNIMTESGAVKAMVSGSGPSVFGIFDDSNSALLAAARIDARGYKAYSCHPVDKLHM